MSAEPQAHGTLGVVLAGVPAGAHQTIERYTARGYDVRIAEIGEGSDVERGLAAVRTAMDAFARRAAPGAIAVAGYGPGGRFAYLAVTRLGANAGAAFSGAGIGEHLAEASLANRPLTLHFGDDDAFVPIEEVRRIKGALEGFATTEIYRYPGARRGFAMRGDPHFDEADAAQAERRVFAVLDALR
jgi:dienelactone hydrolase